MGGQFSSTLLNLVVVPASYALVFGAKRQILGGAAKSHPARFRVGRLGNLRSRDAAGVSTCTCL